MPVSVSRRAPEGDCEAEGRRRASPSRTRNDDVIVDLEYYTGASRAAGALARPFAQNPRGIEMTQDPEPPPAPPPAAAADAPLHARLFCFLTRCLETKKTCLLILVVTLVLVVELTKLFVPSGSGIQESAEKVLQLAQRVLDAVGVGAVSTREPQHGHRGGGFAFAANASEYLGEATGGAGSG